METSKVETRPPVKGISLADRLLRTQREIRDQIYHETIEFNVQRAYSQEQRRVGPMERSAPRLDVAKVPPKPCTVLADMEEFKAEVTELYDRNILMLKEAIRGEYMTMTADIVGILRTCHFELKTHPRESIDWLLGLDTRMASSISSLALGKNSVCGQGEAIRAAWKRKWGEKSNKYLGLVYTWTICERCPNLKELAVWVPDFEVTWYFISAPKEVLRLLENKILDKIRFLLDGFDEDIDDHPLLSELLRKEELDVEELEELYKDNDEFWKAFRKENARITALGPRFDYEVEWPTRFRQVGDGMRTNKAWPNYVLYTFTRPDPSDRQRGVCATDVETEPEDDDQA